MREGFWKEAEARGCWRREWNQRSLKQQRPDVFREVIRATCTSARALMQHFRGWGVRVWLPGGSWSSRTEVYELQNALVDSISRHGLEPADAVHLIVAGLGETHHIVTNDHAFQHVDGITVYASGLAP